MERLHAGVAALFIVSCAACSGEDSKCGTSSGAAAPVCSPGAPASSPALAVSAAPPVASSAPAPAPVAPPAAKLCDQADALKKRLDAIDVSVSRVPLDPKLHLATSTDGKHVPTGTLVVLSGGEIFVDAERFTSADSAGEKLHAKEKQKNPLPVVFAVTREATDLGAFATLAAAVPSKIPVYLVAAPPHSTEEPAPKSIADGLKYPVDADKRAEAMGKELRRAFKTCEVGLHIFQDADAVPADNQSAFLRDVLPGAVAACDCKVADDVVDFAAYVVGGDTAVLGKHVVLSDAASAKAIDLKGMDAQKLYDAIPGDGSPIKLAH